MVQGAALQDIAATGVMTGIAVQAAMDFRRAIRNCASIRRSLGRMAANAKHFIPYIIGMGPVGAGVIGNHVDIGVVRVTSCTGRGRAVSVFAGIANHVGYSTDLHRLGGAVHHGMSDRVVALITGTVMDSGHDVSAPSLIVAGQAGSCHFGQEAVVLANLVMMHEVIAMAIHATPPISRDGNGLTVWRPQGPVALVAGHAAIMHPVVAGAYRYAGCRARRRKVTGNAVAGCTHSGRMVGCGMVGEILPMTILANTSAGRQRDGLTVGLKQGARCRVMASGTGVVNLVVLRVDRDGSRRTRRSAMTTTAVG